jgi:hypothetical protein
MQMMTRDIREIEKIINEKVAVLGKQGIIVSIDGKDGSGKSRLALKLCCRNENFTYFDLDTHYWSSNKLFYKLPYVENIDFDALKNNISKTLESNEVVVIAGVCLLSIFEKLSIQPDVSIYIKKLDSSGWWIDGIKFNYDLNLEELIRAKKESSRKDSELEQFDQPVKTKPIDEDDECLSCEIIRYHFHCKPDKKADIIYKRVCKTDG